MSKLLLDMVGKECKITFLVTVNKLVKGML